MELLYATLRTREMETMWVDSMVGAAVTAGATASTKEYTHADQIEAACNRLLIDRSAPAPRMPQSHTHTCTPRPHTCTHTRARARTHTHAHTHVQDMQDARYKMQEMQHRIAVSLPLAQPIRYNTQTTSMTENHQYDKGWRLDRGLCARSMGTARHQ